MNITTTLAATTAALAGTLVGPIMHEAPVDRPTESGSLSWADCGDGFECATLAVPLDLDDAASRPIDISVTRHLASDQENRIGTLVVGYPLGSFDFVRHAPPGSWELFPQFDVVGYDGRGSGPTQLDCGIDSSMFEAFGATQSRPGHGDDAAMVVAAEQAAARCVDAGGDLLPFMSTADMANDLDLLRQAVGDDQVTYAGISQGTVLGATYASMFPGRVRAMVLDAPVDAAGWRDAPLDIWREQFAGMERTLGRFFAACIAHGDVCRFGDGDPEAAFDALVARLDAEPIESTDPDHPGTIDGDDVRAATANLFYRNPDAWADLAAALEAALLGDGSLFAALRDAEEVNDPALPFFSSFFANAAVDQKYPSLDVAIDEVRRGTGIAPHFWTWGNYVSAVASAWPVEAARPFTGDFEHDARSAPVLVIGGTHDPVTPYAWAERLTADLGNAHLLTYDADGHGTLTDGNACVLGAVVAYLLDPAALPPEGTVCVQEIEPFTT